MFFLFVLASPLLSLWMSRPLFTVTSKRSFAPSRAKPSDLQSHNAVSLLLCNVQTWEPCFHIGFHLAFKAKFSIVLARRWREATPCWRSSRWRGCFYCLKAKKPTTQTILMTAGCSFVFLIAPCVRTDTGSWNEKRVLLLCCLAQSIHSFLYVLCWENATR